MAFRYCRECASDWLGSCDAIQWPSSSSEVPSDISKGRQLACEALPWHPSRQAHASVRPFAPLVAGVGQFVSGAFGARGASWRSLLDLTQGSGWNDAAPDQALVCVPVQPKRRLDNQLGFTNAQRRPAEPSVGQLPIPYRRRAGTPTGSGTHSLNRSGLVP
jgi:hypothetical protein